MLEAYRGHGIDHLVALRGDLPSGNADAGEFRYASELVAFIRGETGDAFHIDVAAYPESHPRGEEPRCRPRATSSARSTPAPIRRSRSTSTTPTPTFDFVDRCAAAGITVPIVPGIMPIASASKLARFSDACGAEIPRWIRRRLEGYGDDATSIRAFGLDVVTDLCARLLAGGAPGLHFYTLNQAALTTTIWQRLGLQA